MPITYNPKTKHYEQDGEPIEPSRITALISKLIVRAKVEAKRITKRFNDGAITYEQWFEAMVSLIESAQIVAASVGRGGRELVENWGKVSERVDWGTSYLPRFAKDIQTEGKLSEAAMNNRAGMYADPAYITYQNESLDKQKDGKEVLCMLVQNSEEGCQDCQDDAARGWVPLSEMDEIGSRSCGAFCRCDLIFSDDDGSGPDFTEAAVNLVFGVSE